MREMRDASGEATRRAANEDIEKLVFMVMFAFNFFNQK